MPNGEIDPKIDYVEKFAGEKMLQLPTIFAARKDALAVQGLLYNELRKFTNSDVDVVVFGSLARQEWTIGSDVDWTMLIDGQADIQHRVTARNISQTLRALKYKDLPLNPPGAEGIFGNMAFSHEIVHHIGGQADTNKNTTQRILLLLEAIALRDSKDELGGPYARITRQVLNRYLLSDSNFHNDSDHESRIPRFLLNDIVRFWRTMCVDFAYKDWEYAGEKWAIRNIKLRTSRKLLFVAGLMMVYSCFKNESLRRSNNPEDNYLLRIQKHLMSFVRSTPLNLLVWTLLDLGFDDNCIEFLNLYEQFLKKINAPGVREHLGQLSENSVYKDPTFLECQQISHSLQSTLKKICFEIKSSLQDFTFEYGVF